MMVLVPFTTTSPNGQSTGLNEGNTVAPVSTAELQRRLDMMTEQGIMTGPMLDRMHGKGLLTREQSTRLVGNYRSSTPAS